MQERDDILNLLPEMPLDQAGSDLPYACQFFDPVSGEGEDEFIFSFALPEKAEVRLSIYTPGGDMVESILEEEVESGFHQVERTLSHLERGVYICILSTSTLFIGLKLILKDIAEYM